MLRAIFFGGIVLGCLLPLCGCEQPAGGDDGRDVLACEAAVVTLLDAPRPAPEPDSPDQSGLGDAAGGLYGGPLDMLRDARSLIDKGNDLADRGKALLDAAQREGKITVDVRLPGGPQSAADAGQSCPGGVCPVVPQQPAAPPSPSNAAATVQGDACLGGVCRPRLLGRLRR